MDLMTYLDFEELLKGPAGPYYQGRWDYFGKVVDFVREQNPNRVLELGPSFLPIVKDGDIMIKTELDNWGRPPTIAPKEYYHDATSTPWPIHDKEYDLFIALQVWEHLEGKQKEAFKEVMRVSNSAVLSFPYKWDCPLDNPNYASHHQIDEKVIDEWTLRIPPMKIVRIPRTGDRISKGPRIIYFWKF